MKRFAFILLVMSSVAIAAIDTENKRRSAGRIGPIPDGAITGVDKQHVGGLYRGIAADTPAVNILTIIDRSIFPIDSRKFFRNKNEASFTYGERTGQMLYWNAALNAYVPTASPVAEDRICFWDSSGGVVAWLNTDGSLEIIDDELGLTNISPLVTKQVDYTALTSDYTVLLDGSVGTVTLTLPAAADNTGRIYCIKCINSDNTVDIDPNGTEEIDGDNANFELIVDETIRIQSDGSNWWIL